MGWDAFAQARGTEAQPSPMVSALLFLLQFAPLFVIFYFLFIRPQRQRQKQVEKMIAALKKGDRVVTTGGIIGTIVGIDDAKAVLKIADDVKVEFTRASIVQVMSAEGG